MDLGEKEGVNKQGIGFFFILSSYKQGKWKNANLTLNIVAVVDVLSYVKKRKKEMEERKLLMGQVTQTLEMEWVITFLSKMWTRAVVGWRPNIPREEERRVLH